MALVCHIGCVVHCYDRSTRVELEVNAIGSLGMAVWGPAPGLESAGHHVVYGAQVSPDGNDGLWLADGGNIVVVCIALDVLGGLGNAMDQRVHSPNSLI